MDEHLPEKTITKFITDKPWVTDQFKDLITQRQRALTNNQTAEYNILRNRVSRHSKRLRSNYYKGKIENLKQSKPGDRWKKTKAFISQSTSGGGELEGMAVDLFDGIMDDLSVAIHSFFHSVSSHLEPLCDSVIPEQYPTNTS